jgi:hypothetical protein
VDEAVTLVLAVRVAGVILLVLAVAHVPIATRLEWQTDAQRLSPVNRQVMLVHAFFVALTVGLMGALTLGWAEALVTPSALGKPVAAGLTLFWAVRLYFQWFVYDRALWRHRAFETRVHVLFTILWTYLTVVYACCLRLQLGAA